jgi:hypothetical protein
MVVKMNKKSQVAIFVIIALIIVVLVAIFFIARRPPDIPTIDEKNPQASIESCTREAVEEAIELLSPRGGDITPKGSVLYEGVDRTYICYSSEYYEPCKNQRPLFVEHIEDEITNYIYDKVDLCFQTLRENLQGKYDIDMGDLRVKTQLHSREVGVEIERYFKMTKGSSVQEFNEFKTRKIHPLYDLAQIANEIANQEAEFCHFDNTGYSLLHPEYEVDQFETGDGDKIYTIRERRTNQEIVVAVRSCVLPPGI